MEAMATLELHRFTVKEYRRMGEVGILGEDERVEVDVGRNVIEVYRSPPGDRYASAEKRRPGDRVSPGALPEVELAVSDILGTT